ncbi:MAG: AtpZ/AtpI family protein [Clostridia bacterium]|nr:AtpZ/AtpI family protein [Clostridia bacterium]
MLRKFITPVYIVNMVLQGFISLAAPIGLLFGAAYLLVTYLSWPEWIYVVFIMLGVFSGLYSMVSFIITASRSLEAIERQHRQKQSGGATEYAKAPVVSCDEDEEQNSVRTDKTNEE